MTIIEALRIAKREALFSIINLIYLSKIDLQVYWLFQHIIYNKYICTFYLILFYIISINIVMNSGKAKTITGMNISIATLEICDYFSERKVSFLYFLINEKSNI